MTKLEKIIKEISELEDKLSQLRKEKVHEMGLRLIKCEACGKKSQAKRFPRLNEIKWDNEPYSEHTYISRIFIMCPKCNELLTLRDEEALRDYKLGDTFEYENTWPRDEFNESFEKAKEWIDNYEINQLSEREKMKRAVKEISSKKPVKKQYTVKL